MNSYGIRKKIDMLGRITIPKSFRAVLGVDIGDEVEICQTDDGIHIKPCSADTLADSDTSDGLKINYMVDDKCYTPNRAHTADAGCDLFTPIDVVIPPRGSAVVDTGVHFEIPANYVGFIKSKSGLNVKYDLTAEGVIDSGYTGSIVVKMYNHSDEVRELHRGDKLTQIVFLPIPPIDAFVEVDSFAETERGDKGFGSTGR